MTEAQAVYTEGNTDLTTYATDISMADYTEGAVNQDLGSIFFATIPDQIEIVGHLETLPGYLPVS